MDIQKILDVVIGELRNNSDLNAKMLSLKRILDHIVAEFAFDLDEKQIRILGKLNEAAADILGVAHFASFHNLPAEYFGYGRKMLRTMIGDVLGEVPLAVFSEEQRDQIVILVYARRTDLVGYEPITLVVAASSLSDAIYRYILGDEFDKFKDHRNKAHQIWERIVEMKVQGQPN